VELALKANLLANGWTRAQLKKDPFGHDLHRLLAEARSKGLTVDNKVEKDIEDLNHVHKNDLARYPEFDGLTTNDGKGIVAVEELEPSVEVLFLAIASAGL
jgi:hypothetical protein